MLKISDGARDLLVAVLSADREVPRGSQPTLCVKDGLEAPGSPSPVYRVCWIPAYELGEHTTICIGDYELYISAETLKFGANKRLVIRRSRVVDRPGTTSLELVLVSE